MILTIITFIVILGLLVFVHEAGHFIVAKRNGVKVEEFGFGFPPRIIGVFKDPETGRWKVVGRKRKQAPATIYSLNWVPLGGFVKIKGEQGEDADDPDSFAHKSVGKRIWIISAGVLMNVILAFVLISFGFVIGLPQVLDEEIPASARVRDEKIQIADVLIGLAAQKQNLQLGDTIISIDGRTFNEIEDVQNYLAGKEGQTVNIKLSRGNKVIEKEMTLEVIPEIGQAGLGVALVKTGIVSLPIHLAVWQGALTTLFLIKEIIFAFGALIKNLVVAREVVVEISGPVGIAVITNQVTRLGFIYILQFAALLSLNLAIINFVPFPALDGGRVLFLIIEKIRGKPINQRVEATIHNIGFVLLMLLVLAVTYRDVFRFSDKFGKLWGMITGMF
jgi:regulator of sigma E protease